MPSWLLRPSRLATIGDGSVTRVRYKYLGAGKILTTDYEDIDVKLDYFASHLAGLDRFGRVLDQVWRDYGATPEDFDIYAYVYDRVGNRTSRDNALHSAFNEDYAYDALDRLESVTRADSFNQDWTLDGLGNWSAFDDGGTSQNRTANAANEIQSISGVWADPIYDAAGNMIRWGAAEDPDHEDEDDGTYDAWNRLVEYESEFYAGVTFKYDGLGRRVAKIVGGATTIDYYYNEDWRLLQENLNGDIDPLYQYVWHPYYIDALAMRYSGPNTDGRWHYYCQDANFNVTAVTDDAGAVVERYNYTPYGEVTFLASNFSPLAASQIGNTHVYTGREMDRETGLQLNRNRYYASHLGRWINRDPIGYEGGTRNLYEYVGSSPIVLTDSEGLFPSGYPYYPSPPVGTEQGFQLCQRNVGPGTPYKWLINMCGGEHQYIQYDPCDEDGNKTPECKGWGFSGGGANKPPTNEKHFHPSSSRNLQKNPNGTPLVASSTFRPMGIRDFPTGPPASTCPIDWPQKRFALSRRTGINPF